MADTDLVLRAAEVKGRCPPDQCAFFDQMEDEAEGLIQKRGGMNTIREFEQLADDYIGLLEQWIKKAKPVSTRAGNEEGWWGLPDRPGEPPEVKGDHCLLFPGMLMGEISRVPRSEDKNGQTSPTIRARNFALFYAEVCASLRRVEVSEDRTMVYEPGNGTEKLAKSLSRRLRELPFFGFHRVEIDNKGAVFVDGKCVARQARKILLSLCLRKGDEEEITVSTSEIVQECYGPDKSPNSYIDRIIKQLKTFPFASVQTSPGWRRVRGFRFVGVQPDPARLKELLADCVKEDARIENF